MEVKDQSSATPQLCDLGCIPGVSALICKIRVSILWTARRSSQFILKEISPDFIEGLMLKLKLQYFGHLVQKTDSFDKTLMLGKTEVGRRRGEQRMR